MMKCTDIRRLIAPLTVAGILAACSGVPSGVIAPDRMARLLADLEVAETYAELEPGKFRGDSMKMILLQSVCSHNGVTTEQFDTSIVWYGRHIDRYSEVTKKAVELLEADEEKARLAVGRRSSPDRSIPSVSADGDSVDVWTLPRMWRISAASPASMIRFHLSRDRNWEPGDAYQLRYKAHGASAPVSVTLAADYQRDRRAYISRSDRSDGWHTVSLQLDSAYGASQVYGFISCTPADGEILVIDSVSLIRSHWKSGKSSVPPDQKSVEKR